MVGGLDTRTWTISHPPHQQIKAAMDGFLQILPMCLRMESLICLKVIICSLNSSSSSSSLSSSWISRNLILICNDMPKCSMTMWHRKRMNSISQLAILWLLSTLKRMMDGIVGYWRGSLDFFQPILYRSCWRRMFLAAPWTPAIAKSHQRFPTTEDHPWLLTA